MREIEALHLHPPNLIKQVAEILRLAEITPNDICSKGESDLLAKLYPDVYGDKGEIDTGWGGTCQSWRGVRGWWRNFIADVKNQDRF